MAGITSKDTRRTVRQRARSARWARVTMIGPLVLTLIWTTGAASAPVASAQTAAVVTATPAYIIRSLNALREANGIPAGILGNSTWNARCKKHDNYMAVNNVLTHYEVTGDPAYTAGGAWAGKHSVLDYGSTWMKGNPYKFAPIHLAQLLQPRLKHVGAFELAASGTRWGCTVTIAGWTRKDPPTNRIYTYPGDGATGVSYTYVAKEIPETPNAALGIPNKTGQQLFVFASGPILTPYDLYSIRITGASLHPAGGSNVKVRIADALVPFEGMHLGNYLGPGAGIVIPVNPLRPSTKYVASVTMKGNGMVVRRTWSFTTKNKPA
jgi:cysteine-rich secretory family protein